MPDEMFEAAHVEAREIPIPTSISPEARAMLARGPLGAGVAWPDLDDTPGWLATVQAMDEGALAMFAALAQTAGRDREEIGIDEWVVDGVPLYAASPAGLPEGDRRVVLNVHGGAWVQGAGQICRAGTATRAQAFGVRTVSVDYRMPPLHPFPAAIDDAVVAYRALLERRDAKEIVVAGDSAGGNIAAGLMFALRDVGLPLPAGLVLDTPATDLSGSGDSLAVNDGVDTVLVGDLRPAMALYAGGADLRNPRLSPLHGDFSGDFPVALLLTGTRDRLLSDTVRLHRAMLAAGAAVELHVFEAQGHGGFMGLAPEDRDRAEVVARFIVDRLGE